MATRELSLFVDLDKGQLVQGIDSTLPAILPAMFVGDSIPVSIRALKSSRTNQSAIWDEVDLTGKTVRLAIGTPSGTASTGTFKLTYGGDTTSTIAFDASSATIQTALNALASITSAGGVVVTRSGTTGAFRIVFNTAGARTAFTADTAALYPSSGAEIRVSIEGSGSLREIVVARLEVLPAAYTELADEFPEASATITNVRVGSSGVGAIISLIFPVIPYAGSYALTIGGHITGAIPWNATTDEIKSAVEASYASYVDMISVSGEFPSYTIGFDPSLGNVGTMTITLTALVVPKGRSGIIGLNTAAMIELLNGEAQASGKLEVELYDNAASTTWTVAQAECAITDDVIGNAPSSETGGPEYVLSGSTPTFPSLSVTGGPYPGFIEFANDPGDSYVSLLQSTPYAYSDSWTWTLPDYSGTVAMDAVSYLNSPTTGQTLSVAGYRENTFFYLTPAGTIATLTINLPTSTDTRDQQRIEIFSTQIVTALTVNAGSGNTLGGTSLTELAANTIYEYTYIASVSKWVRIK